MPASSTVTAKQTAAPSIYDRRFWLSYAANLVLVTANALTFRFAEFVTFLGGTEQVTGEIIRVGVIGALGVRLVLGRDLDRLGVRRTWIACSVLFTLGCGMILIATDLGWPIYVGRVMYAVGLASMFTCSLAYIQNLAPPERRTEIVGTLGSSGFLGMILGAQLGDLIFLMVPRLAGSTGEAAIVGRDVFHVLFGATVVCGLIYLAVVVSLTHGDRHAIPKHTLPLHRLMRQHWPGPVVLVAIMMGVGLAVTTVFLTRYTTSLGLSGIRTFFTAYAISAFTFRMMSRTWSRSIGRRRMMLMGLGGHAIGHLMLTQVSAEWHLILPALACGFGHALLFPCVVSLGSESFPAAYRGTGVTLIMGFVDLGTGLSAPILGRLIDTTGFHAMYYTSAGCALLIALAYGWLSRSHIDTDMVGESAKRRETVNRQPVSAMR